MPRKSRNEHIDNVNGFVSGMATPENSQEINESLREMGLHRSPRLAQKFLNWHRTQSDVYNTHNIENIPERKIDPDFGL